MRKYRPAKPILKTSHFKPQFSQFRDQDIFSLYKATREALKAIQLCYGVNLRRRRRISLSDVSPKKQAFPFEQRTKQMVRPQTTCSELNELVDMNLSGDKPNRHLLKFLRFEREAQKSIHMRILKKNGISNQIHPQRLNTHEGGALKFRS